MVIKIGSAVCWRVGKGRNKKIISGIVFKLNPSISPGSKYAVIDNSGEVFYPIGKVSTFCKMKQK